MTESERLAIVREAAHRMGFTLGFIIGSFTSIVGTAFVVARWFTRCR